MLPKTSPQPIQSDYRYHPYIKLTCQERPVLQGKLSTQTYIIPIPVHKISNIIQRVTRSGRLNSEKETDILSKISLLPNHIYFRYPTFSKLNLSINPYRHRIKYQPRYERVPSYVRHELEIVDTFHDHIFSDAPS